MGFPVALVKPWGVGQTRTKWQGVGFPGGLATPSTSVSSDAGPASCMQLPQLASIFTVVAWSSCCHIQALVVSWISRMHPVRCSVLLVAVCFMHSSAGAAGLCWCVRVCVCACACVPPGVGMLLVVYMCVWHSICKNPRIRAVIGSKHCGTP